MAHTSPSSFSIHGLTSEAAYQHLDEEIAQLQSRLSSLRTLRNSLAPICKIPTELLSKIFTHAQEYNGSVFSQEADLDTRFIVTWVCRHWRDTALADSTLWTLISRVDVHADLVQELLNRSQNSSLSVDLQEPSVDMSKLCLSQLSRIRHLRLATLPNSSEVEDLLVRPAPLITSLELVNIYLPSAPLFSEVHPHLRHVILEDVPFLSPSPSISLIISTLRIVNPSEFIEVEYLVGLLPFFRSLTELVLVLCFNHSSAIVPPLQRIALPTLQVLSVIDREYMTIFGFLTCLDVPQAAITVIWPGAFGEWMTHFEMNQFLTGIHLYSHEAKIPLLIRHLKLDRNAGDCTIDISSSPSHHRHSFSFPKQDLDSRFTHKFLTWAIPLDNIETLVINDLPEDTLNSIIGSTTLNSLTVSGEEASWKCISALDLEPGHATVSFPALKELTICGIEVEDESEPVLESILAKRQEAGFSLNKLMFVGCKSVAVANFKANVQTVEIVE